MARPKRVASMGTSSVESSPQKDSPAKKRLRSATKPTSPLRTSPRRSRLPKSPRTKTQSKTRQVSAETEISKTSALVRALSVSQKSSGVSVTEADIIAAKSPSQVTKLINTLVSTDQDELFRQYKETSEEQQVKDSQSIAELTTKLDERQTTIDTLTAQISELQNSLDTAEEKLEAIGDTSTHAQTPQRRRGKEMYQSPIRRKPSDAMVHRTKVDDEFKTIAFTFDMLELLTGVRIISYKVDDDKFLFDVKQTSTVTEQESDVVTIEYQLMIQRDFEEKAEVTYIPVFLDALGKRARNAEQEAKNKDAERVKVHLPGYLQQSLNFPYNTLSQFYIKLSKALNKGTKT
ncbi:hypothetical protein JCM33374_g5255 [Metschnikowia sp. JCM 33374]|nr:hypothetical protein JCM33374_g5255 [Metschnikowia sp. JCM 33374]